MPAVRHLVEAALPFHRALGFKPADRRGPHFAIVKRRSMSIGFSGPGTSARRARGGSASRWPRWKAATDSSRTRCWRAPLVALLLCGPAAAQKADRPDVRAGDQWRFAVAYGDHVSAEPNRVWIVTSVGAGVIEATENGEPLLLTPELNVRESPREVSSNPRALQFPLEVGKRWRYETDWMFKPKASHGSIVIDVEVVAFEKLTVPAGEFDAFRLVARGVLRGTSPIGSRYDAATTTTYWYAPKARAVVKSVHHNPYLGRSTAQLVDFRPGVH